MPNSNHKIYASEERATSKTVSVAEKINQKEIDRIVEDEKRIVNKIKRGKFADYVDEEAEEGEDDDSEEIR